jgi:hypothetical protein
MSSEIPLQALPNQSLSITLDGIRYGIRLRSTKLTIAIDLTINEEEVLMGSRVVAGSPVIPYKYLKNGGGNFVFITELDDLIYWEKFGINQSMIYFTIEELESINGN